MEIAAIEAMSNQDEANKTSNNIVFQNDDIKLSVVELQCKNEHVPAIITERGVIQVPIPIDLNMKEYSSPNKRKKRQKPKPEIKLEPYINITEIHCQGYVQEAFQHYYVMAVRNIVNLHITV